MRRIKLVVALAAAMVVLMMAAAPAMADIDIGNVHFDNDLDNNFNFGNLGNLFVFNNASGLGDNGDVNIGDNGFSFG